MRTKIISRHIEKLTFANGNERYVAHVLVNKSIFFGIFRFKKRLYVGISLARNISKYTFNSKNRVSFKSKNTALDELETCIKNELLSYVVKKEIIK
nr:hypothetical protein [uncultured Flavobacterium sp.]